MIEFKADCGHTVRAKDEDVGKVVRCAYCGREAEVPDEQADDGFDLFFSEMMEGDESAGSQAGSGSRAGKDQAVVAGPRRTRRPVVGSHVRRTADPFAIITKMAYVAVILMFVIFVGKKWVWPIVTETFLTESEKVEPPPSKPERENARRREPIRRPPQPQRFGLIKPMLRQGKQGIFVNAVPPDVSVYFKRAEEKFSRKSPPAADWYSWIERSDTATIPGPTYWVQLPPADYDVVVTLPINDRQLMTSYPDYPDAFRRRVERPGTRTTERDRVANEYFLPDESIATRILTTRNRLTIVRLYRMSIRAGEWQVLTPLFLPLASNMLEIVGYVDGREIRFRFDDAFVEQELTYYQVPESDRRYVKDILSRIGAISYHEAFLEGNSDRPNKEYAFRMFRIDPQDGGLTAWEIDGGALKRSRHSAGKLP